MNPTKKLPLLLLVAACLPALQGCFPVAAVGMTASALLVTDRRTVAAQAVDQELEYRIGRRLETEISKSAHVTVTSFNQTVLLTGEVPNQTDRAKAEEIAKAMPYSPNVVNDLQVRPASSLISRSDDALLTSTIKSRLAGSDVVLPNHVKIISEDGAVYVMGLVTEREARAALQIAAESSGVVKVVNVTQLIRDPEEVRREEDAKRPLPPDPETSTPLWRPQRP